MKRRRTILNTCGYVGLAYAALRLGGRLLTAILLTDHGNMGEQSEEELRDAFLLWSGGKEKIPREKMHDALTKLGNKFTESEFEAFMGDGAVPTAPSSSAPQSPNRLPVSCMQHCAR